MLRNLLTNQEYHFSSVSDYSFENNGKVLVLKTTTIDDGDTIGTIEWVDLVKRKSTRFGLGLLTMARIRLKGTVSTPTESS